MCGWWQSRPKLIVIPLLLNNWDLERENFKYGWKFGKCHLRDGMEHMKLQSSTKIHGTNPAPPFNVVVSNAISFNIEWGDGGSYTRYYSLDRPDLSHHLWRRLSERLYKGMVGIYMLYTGERTTVEGYLILQLMIQQNVSFTIITKCWRFFHCSTDLYIIAIIIIASIKWVMKFKIWNKIRIAGIIRCSHFFISHLNQTE